MMYSRRDRPAHRRPMVCEVSLKQAPPPQFVTTNSTCGENTTTTRVNTPPNSVERLKPHELGGE